MTKRALGRGLSALLPQEAPVGEEVRMVDIDLIRPSEDQPRTQFDEQPRSATNPTSATSTRAAVGPTTDRHCPSVSAQGPPVPIIAFFMQISIIIPRAL